MSDHELIATDESILEGAPTEWRAVCKCGWDGNWYTRPDAPADEYLEHSAASDADLLSAFRNDSRYTFAGDPDAIRAAFYGS